MPSTATIPLGRVTAGSHLVDLPGIDWVETGDPGFQMKEVFKDPETGDSTLLIKVAPGAFVGEHAHSVHEEIFVLEGDFHDSHMTYRAGQYCQRAIGEMHTAGSASGAVVLLIFRAPRTSGPQAPTP